MADDWCCKGTDPSCDGPQECANRAALLLEAQQTEIERLRAVADHLAEVLRQYMDADNWTHDDGFIALADAVDALRAWEETRRG